MNDLDKKIREALRQEDADALKEFDGELSIFEMLTETFRGRHRWLNILGMFWTLIFMGLAIYSAVQFFKVEIQRDMLMWAAAFLFCMSAVSMLKIWYWMEMQKNSVTREIKRLELQIARLAGRLEI